MGEKSMEVYLIHAEFGILSLFLLWLKYFPYLYLDLSIKHLCFSREKNIIKKTRVLIFNDMLPSFVHQMTANNWK